MGGLLERDINYIIKAVEVVKNIQKVIIFGSRAMGNYKKGSDVDLALVGEGITTHELHQVFDALNEVYPLPYFFDMIKYEDIKNDALKAHIDSKGIVLWER